MSQIQEKPLPTSPRAFSKSIQLRYLVQDLQDPSTRALQAILFPSIDSGPEQLLTRAIEHFIRLLVLPFERIDLAELRWGGSNWTKEVRSITLELDSKMDGVAYTKGLELDESHKEIHLSTRYAQKVIKQDPDQAKRELEGIITHEMVHCFQLDLQGRCDSGLIEGIADWVRMKSGFGAKHWNENNIGTRWNDGYEKTAFFLEWVSTSLPTGPDPFFVPKLNHYLSTMPQTEDFGGKDAFRWASVDHEDWEVDRFWQHYVEKMKKEDEDESERPSESLKMKADRY